MQLTLTFDPDEIPDLIATLVPLLGGTPSEAMELLTELRDDHTELAARVDRLVSAVSDAAEKHLRALSERVAALERDHEICGADITHGSAEPIPCTIRRGDYLGNCQTPGCRFREDDPEPTLYRQYQAPEWQPGTDYQVGDWVQTPEEHLGWCNLAHHSADEWPGFGEEWRGAWASQLPDYQKAPSGEHYWRPDVGYQAGDRVDSGGVLYEATSTSIDCPPPGSDGYEWRRSWRRVDAPMAALQPHHLPDDHTWAVAHLYARGCKVWHEGHQYRALHQTSTNPSDDACDWHCLTTADPETP